MLCVYGVNTLYSTNVYWVDSMCEDFCKEPCPYVPYYLYGERSRTSNYNEVGPMLRMRVWGLLILTG